MGDTDGRNPIVAAIRARRLAAEITQQQLSAVCGLTPQRWTRIENGLCDPKLSTLLTVCTRLGLTLAVTSGDSPAADDHTDEIGQLRDQLAEARTELAAAQQQAGEARQRARAAEHRAAAAEVRAVDADRHVRRALAALDAAARTPKLGHDFIDHARDVIRSTAAAGREVAA